MRCPLTTSVALVALSSAIPAQSIAEPLRWDEWGGGKWLGSAIAVEADAAVLTIRYTVGETPDAWPNAELTFAQPQDLGDATELAFEIRISAETEVLPDHHLSVLMQDANGLRRQINAPSGTPVIGEWSPQLIDLMDWPQGFLRNTVLLQFFVWNRDYHNAGIPAGTEVTLELRQPRLVGERPNIDVGRFNQPPLQRMLGRSGGMAVWSEPADTKILPERPVPDAEPAPVELSAARNEYADFQIAVRADASVSGVSLEVTPPRRRGKGFRTQVRLEGLVETVNPSSYIIRAGLCPDPLLLDTQVDLAPGETRGFWVNLYVPATAKPGEYVGDITVRVAGQEALAARYRLSVHDFALPESPALRTAFQLAVEKDWSGMMSYYPDADFDMVKSLWESMADHRIAPMHPSPKGPPRPADPESMAEFDRYIDLAEELRFNSFGPFYFDAPVETEEERQWTRRMTDYYAEKGLLDRLYVYICSFDEAQPDRYPALREYAEALKKAEPRLPRFITVAPHPDLYGAIDWWCPVVRHYDKEVARQRRAQGEKVWWYTCWNFSPGLLIDHPGAEHRALLWLTFTQEADGLLFWCIDFWRKNPWEVTEQGPGTNGNGDGYLLYPRREGDPPDRFYETVRLQILRDAIEDYDYLAILKARLEAAGPSHAKAVAGGNAALAAAGRIATHARDYSLAPSDYAYVRSLVADAIEALPPAE